MMEIPEGWKLVPLEPDREMENAGGSIQIPAHCDECPNYEYDLGGFYARQCWAAMIATAPEPPSAASPASQLSPSQSR